MPQLRCGPGRRRAAFTLIELLVVLGIISVLVALLAAAVVKTLGTMQAQATDSTLEKVASELNKQWKVVIDQAGKEAVPDTVTNNLAGGDVRRARVIWVKLRLKQEFPTSYQEALAPAPGYLNPKNVFVKAFPNPPAKANDPNTESSACLLLSLTQARGGLTWDAENTLGAGSIRDTDNDGNREILDSWGNPIYFIRVPIQPNTPWSQDLNPLQPGAPPPGLPPGMKQGTNDAQDPEGLLTNPQWVRTFGPAFAPLVHPVFAFPQFPNAQARGYSWQNLSPFVGSAGPYGYTHYGLNDNRFSYRLKKQGAGGER